MTSGPYRSARTALVPYYQTVSTIFPWAYEPGTSFISDVFIRFPHFSVAIVPQRLRHVPGVTSSRLRVFCNVVGSRRLFRHHSTLLFTTPSDMLSRAAWMTMTCVFTFSTTSRRPACPFDWHGRCLTSYFALHTSLVSIMPVVVGIDGVVLQP